MTEIALRRTQLIVDKIWHEGGPALKEPRLRGAILAVIKNPFAGRYVEEIQSFMKPLESLGVGLARELAEALGGPKAVQSYGKASIVGLDGELVAVHAQAELVARHAGQIGVQGDAGAVLDHVHRGQQGRLFAGRGAGAADVVHGVLRVHCTSMRRGCAAARR